VWVFLPLLRSKGHHEIKYGQKSVCEQYVLKTGRGNLFQIYNFSAVGGKGELITF